MVTWTSSPGSDPESTIRQTEMIILTRRHFTGRGSERNSFHFTISTWCPINQSLHLQWIQYPNFLKPKWRHYLKDAWLPFRWPGSSVHISVWERNRFFDRHRQRGSNNSKLRLNQFQTQAQPMSWSRQLHDIGQLINSDKACSLNSALKSTWSTTWIVHLNLPGGDWVRRQ